MDVWMIGPDPSYVRVFGDEQPCSGCAQPTLGLDLDFCAVLCWPCRVDLIEHWVFETYTHCGLCEREFTDGFLHLGARRGTRRWRYCLHCNFRGPSITEWSDRLPEPPPPPPAPARTATGWIKGHAL